MGWTSRALLHCTGRPVADTQVQCHNHNACTCTYVYMYCVYQCQIKVFMYALGLINIPAHVMPTDECHNSYYWAFDVFVWMFDGQNLRERRQK